MIGGEKLRIALVTDTYHPQINGVISSIDTIREELEKEYNVYIFAPTKSGRAQGFNSFPFYFWPEYRIAYVRAKTLAKIFQEKEIEIVHIHTPFSLGVSGVGAARHLNLPAIGTFHSLLSEYNHYISGFSGLLLREFGWSYVTWFYRRFNIVTVPSNSIKEVLLERGLKNVYTIPNAININVFHPGEDPLDSDPRILFVGRLGREKRLEVLIESAKSVLKEYPQVKFHIVGKGIHEDWYKKRVKEKGLSNNFVFKGYVSSQDLIKAYQKCDIFTIPSNTETQGLVALEAMACGKPVVGANALGLKDTITHEVDGYLFQPGDSSELAYYLIQLLDDNKLRREMGRRAREKAKDFSIEKIRVQWINLYSSLVR